MQRLFICPENIDAHRVTIRGEPLRKVRTVLRMGPNDRLAVFDDTGVEYLCRVVTLTATEGVLEIIEIKQAASEPSCEIHLGQALPKSDKMAYIIQKAVELGVAAIHPFASERSIPRYDTRQTARRMDRWQKVALEAAQQSGRSTIPVVNAPIAFDEVLRVNLPPCLKIILHHDGNTRMVKALLRGEGIKRLVFFLVGPEGGFTPQELALAEEQGFEVARLGPRTLRTETAALVLLSIIQYEFDEIR